MKMTALCIIFCVSALIAACGDKNILNYPTPNNNIGTEYERF